MIPFPISVSILADGDEMPDNLFGLAYYDGTQATPKESGGVALGVNDADTIQILAYDTTITTGQIFSIHERDDSTSYQNVSGANATAVLNIQAQNAGSTRHIRIWSSPNDDSKTSATLILEIDQTGILDNAAEILTVICPKIQNNHYLVIENAGASTEDIKIPLSRPSYVVERG